MQVTSCKLGWAQTPFPRVQEQEPCGPKGLRADARMGAVGSVCPGVFVEAIVSSICMSVGVVLVAGKGSGRVGPGVVGEALPLSICSMSVEFFLAVSDGGGIGLKSG